ncbi:MAG TPA: metal ABC transporter ATP-binding protein [Caldilineae bacterium]|nr:metal ABC transporter ATP-binding protein [Caldilineae bacterium]
MAQSLQQLRYPVARHEPGAPSLVVEHVSMRFNGVTALDDISFEVNTGERIAVVGPNGAGKSTLFNVISGALRPSSGQIHVFGHEPGGHICIGYVPQRNRIDWSFPVTVSDVVMMGRVGKIGLFRWPKQKDWQVVESALARVGMEGLARRQIGELSGGQQQRVFIARALAQEAELLLLDEPLTGLDTPSQEAILGIFDSLKADDITILVATHDLDQASTYFDRMMLLNRRLIAFGKADEVYTPEHLVATYGGHLHVLPGGKMEEKRLLVADTCCGGGEP